MSAIARLHTRLIEALGVLAGVAFALGAQLITLDVILRNVAARGLPWLVDVIEYGLLVSTFLAAPWVLREGAHVALDLVVGALPRRLARPMELLANGLGAAICLVLLYYSGMATLAAQQRGSLILKTVVFPEWWALAVIPFGSLLLVIEFALRLRRVAAPAAQG